MATKDYKTNREIQIAVKPGNRGVVDKKTKRKGMSEPSKRQKPFLHRRTSRGIRLFDLGQQKTGATWTSITVQIAPPLEGSTGFDDPGIRNIQLSDFQAVANSFIETVGDWTKIFRPITKGGLMETRSRISVQATSFGGNLPELPPDIWTDAGLKISDADLADGITIENFSGFVEPITLVDNGTYKITALPSFDAPAVPFTAARIMNVFLVPGLILPYVEAGYITVLGGPFAELGGYFYTTIYRPHLFDSADPHFNAFTNPVLLSGWENFYYCVQWLKSEPAAKAGLLDFFPDVWGPHSMAAFATVQGLPAPPAVGYTGPGQPRYDRVVGYGPYNGGLITQPAFPFSGALMAVVQKGSNKFYFWSP